jgi:putative ABC transport system permease protein
LRVSLALRLALRDLRGGLSGLRLLAVCLFLGVLALAAVGSLPPRSSPALPSAASRSSAATSS